MGKYNLSFSNVGSVYLDSDDKIIMNYYKRDSSYVVGSCTQHYYKIEENLYQDYSNYSNRGLIKDDLSGTGATWYYNTEKYVSGEGSVNKNVNSGADFGYCTGLTWNLGMPYPDFTGNTRTVSFWIYVDVFPTNSIELEIIKLQNTTNVLIGKPGVLGGYRNDWYIRLNGSGVLYSTFSGGSSTTTTSPLVKYTWYNIVSRLYQGGTVLQTDIWINGTHIDSSSQGSSTTPSSINQLDVLSTPSPGGKFYVDEIIIENCLWSDSYIQEYYNAQKSSSRI